MELVVFLLQRFGGIFRGTRLGLGFRWTGSGREFKALPRYGEGPGCVSSQVWATCVFQGIGPFSLSCQIWRLAVRGLALSPGPPVGSVTIPCFFHS